MGDTGPRTPQKKRAEIDTREISTPNRTLKALADRLVKMAQYLSTEQQACLIQRLEQELERLRKLS